MSHLGTATLEEHLLDEALDKGIENEKEQMEYVAMRIEQMSEPPEWNGDDDLTD